MNSIYAILLVTFLLFMCDKFNSQTLEHNMDLSNDKSIADLKKTLELRKEQLNKMHQEKVINHMKNRVKVIISQKLAQSWNPEIYAGLRRG